MDLDARPYRYFLAIADSGSFRRAAEMLHASQPALSAQIRELERRLGFDLFARSSRRVALTPEGRLFLDKARRLVMETDWINQAARDIRSNQLRIGAAHHTASIPERCALIDNFMVRAPEVPLRVLRRNPAQLREDLSRGDIDIAITLELETDATNSATELDPADTQRWVVARKDVRLLVPLDHPAAQIGSIDIADLRGLEICIVDRSHGVPLAEGIGRALADVGAVLAHPPEGDAQSVRRQAARLGKCAIDLGWFPGMPAEMTSVTVPGLGLASSLVVLSSRINHRSGAARFLATVVDT